MPTPDNLILPVGSSLWATKMDKSLLDGLPSLKGTTGIEIILLHTGAYGYRSD